MTLPLAAIPSTIAAVTAALPDWTPTAPVPPSNYHRDYDWVSAGHVVHLAVWDSASRAAVTISYRKGGSEVGHCVLVHVGQVRMFLRLHGLVEPTVVEVAEAALVAL